MIWFLQSSVSDRKSFANVLGTLQFIEHGDGIVLRGDFAIALFVLDKPVFPHPVLPHPLSGGDWACRAWSIMAHYCEAVTLTRERGDTPLGSGR